MWRQGNDTKRKHQRTRREEVNEMKDIKIFDLIPSESVYIVADNIVAFRKFGEGVRIYLVGGEEVYFDVKNTLQEVLYILRRD